MKVLQDQTAVVSGLTSEYAAPMIQMLNAQGAQVMLVDADADALYDHLRGIERAAGFVCDMTEDGIRTVYEEIRARAGAVDVLITCPPARAYQPFPDVSLEAFRDILAASLDHAATPPVR